MGKEIYNIINDMAEVLNASQMQKLQFVVVKEEKVPTVPKRCQEIKQMKIQYENTAVLCRFCHQKA